MNYLAHFYLAGNSNELIIGNFIADFVKGNKIYAYEDLIMKGIKMHRDIDTFTDNHPIVYKTKERLFDRYHKYAGVVVDVYYDHILAKNWEKYAEKKLPHFARDIYTTLQANQEILPEKAKITLHYMAGSDWLSNYAHKHGIERTFHGLSRRTKFDSGMENSIEELKRDELLIGEEFEQFFPELMDFIQHYRL